MTGFSALLSALGGVFLLFGLLSAMLAVFQPVTNLAWVWGNLVIGGVLLATGLASNFESVRERMSSGEARRASRYGTSAIASTLLGIAILCMLSFLSTRYTKRFDWSEQGVHTLSEQSLQVLEALEGDVQVTALFRALDAPQVRDLLERYDYASERFTLDFADPNVRPDLVESLGVNSDNLSRGIVLIAYRDESVELDEFSESNITNALVKLTRTGEKKVYFLEGHGQRPIEGEGANEKSGFERAAQALRNENYRVELLLLGSLADVPDDADVVVVAGPTRPLLHHEHAALRRYIAGGGALLALVDPRAKTDFYDDLVVWGLELGDDVVVDRQLSLFGQATSPMARQYGDHPITRELRETSLFHMVRSVGIDESVPGDYTVIVSTGDDSWAERDLEGWTNTGRAVYEPDDLLGPVPIGVAGSPKFDGDGVGADADPADSADETAANGERQPRLVVFGDSDFASNELIDAYRNRDLFVNAVNWLMGDVESITVRPHLARASRFELSAEQFRSIQFLSLFILPQAIAILGVLAWWARRKAPGR